MSYEDFFFLFLIFPFFFLLLFNDTSKVMSEAKGHGGCVKVKEI